MNKCSICALHDTTDMSIYLAPNQKGARAAPQAEPNPSREVTAGHGSKFLPFGGPSAPIEFLFWDHWEKAVLGQILAGRRARVRSREVMGGYGRLREVTEEENGGKWRNGRKKV